MIDFTSIAQLLRSHLAQHPPIVTGEGMRMQLHPESMIARDALVKVESELCAQSILYLYDHLTAHEQWRKAAILLAHCLPHCALDREDIRALVAKAAKFAEIVETPAGELSRYLQSDFVHRVPDFMARPEQLTPRGRYWIQVARLREAKRALEWACGAGLHVMQAAQLYPEVMWYGIDAKESQVEQANAQAARLGLVDRIGVDPDERLFCSFPVVACLDTIEHTVHPAAMLDSVERYAAPGGVVVVTVPDGPWGLATSDRPVDPPGNHVNVQHAREFVPFIEGRGTILDARVIPGPFSAAEGNETLAITYRPGR